MAHEPSVGMQEAPITVLVVDDESLARQRLLLLLAAERDVRVVGECANGLEALSAIGALTPELVFLDVQMPDLDGLGVIDALGSACPQILFVSAYSEHMRRAWEIQAVDYLEKPYTTERFQTALRHARVRVLSRRLARADAPPPRIPDAVLAAMRVGRVERIIVRNRRTQSWQVLTADQIDWIESDGNGHVRVHTADTSYPWENKTMADAEQQLTSYGFLRVHRTAIVNAARIRSVKALQKGEYALVLDRGAVIDTGRTYREVVEQFLHGG